jgi:YbbR domain-containing protein
MSTLRARLVRVLLAIGLSFALWAFVSFSQNPEDSITFSDVPLQTVGLQDGLVIVDANGLPTLALPTVDITLRTDQQQLATLRPVDVRAIVDLSGRGAGEHQVPVNVQPTRSNLSFTVLGSGVEPAIVSIRLEALRSQATPIQLDVRGNLPFSFERGEPRISFGGQAVSAVEVEGPQSRVERVAAVLAVANIEQLRATYLAPLTLTAVDSAGQEVEGLRITPATVTVEIPINPVVGLKLVPVVPAVVGQPAPGFAVAGVTVEPPLIAVTGGSGLLDAVSQLSTAALDLAGARADVTRAVPIVFPENISRSENEPDVVRVSVRVVPVDLPFQVTLPAAVSLSGLGAGLQATLTPQVVTITFTGSSAALDAFSQTPLRASVDVSGLGPGTYQLPAIVTLPENVSLAGEAPEVTVSLRFPPAPTSPPSTSTPEPTDTAERPSPTGEPASPTPTPEPPTSTPEPPTPTPNP